MNLPSYNNCLPRSDNSAIFYIGANNEYDLHILQLDSAVYAEYAAKSPGEYDKVDASAWRSRYDTAFVSYGTLVLVVDEYRSQLEDTTKTDEGAVAWNFTGQLMARPSSRTLLGTLTNTTKNTQDWILLDYMFNLTADLQQEKESPSPPKYARIQHAFVQRVDATASKIQASLTFLVIVIVCNFIKLLIMLWVVFMEHKQYIVTLGDGAASFLEHRDATTERMCMLSKREITGEVAEASFTHSDQLEWLVMESKMKWSERTIMYSNIRNMDREVGTSFL